MRLDNEIWVSNLAKLTLPIANDDIRCRLVSPRDLVHVEYCALDLVSRVRDQVQFRHASIRLNDDRHEHRSPNGHVPVKRPCGSSCCRRTHAETRTERADLQTQVSMEHCHHCLAAFSVSVV